MPNSLMMIPSANGALSRKPVQNWKCSSAVLAWRLIGMMRDHIAVSLVITTDNLQDTPFLQRGGLGHAARLFGTDLTTLLDELNGELVA